MCVLFFIINLLNYCTKNFLKNTYIENFNVIVDNIISYELVFFVFIYVYIYIGKNKTNCFGYNDYITMRSTIWTCN